MTYKQKLHKFIICHGIGGLLLLVQISSIAQGTVIITIESVRQHMDSIASDVPEGRSSPAFIGDGVIEPKSGRDDFAETDMEGRWAIIQNGIPPDDANPEYSERLRKKYSNRKVHDSLKLNAFIRHKAAGLILLPDKIAQVLFEEQSYNPIVHEAIYHSFVFENIEIQVTIDYKKESVNSFNVAVVPGTDPELKNEYIKVGVHLDHLGKIGNNVYNGANDDASGCVIILEVTRAIALNRSKKSVRFILYTLEEQNLMDSKHFLKNIPVPIEQISLNINIEQIGSNLRDTIGIWAIGDTQFIHTFYKTNRFFRESDIKYSTVEEFKNCLISRVDLWSYYDKGIPVVMLSSSAFPEHHTIHEKIDLIDVEHLHNSAKLLYAFITEVGNN